jgi:fatty acid desaturase
MVPVQRRDEDGPARLGQPQEGEKQRVDRELIELLTELRVALPGVQVLFAFLLIVPFSNGYTRMTGWQRAVYFSSFLATAASSALLIAPSAYHRLHFRSMDKERMLLTSNRLAIAGMACLAAAIGLTTFLVTGILFAVPTAVVVTAATTAWFAWFWYGLPLARKRGEPPA